jgi:hypothetical protein
MPFVHPAVVLMHVRLVPTARQLGERLRHRLVHRLLIRFERQHLIGVQVANLAGDGGLAAHRVHRHDAAGQGQRS